MEGKLNWKFAALIIIVLALLFDKTKKPYHSSVYSSWEEEQIDELRADLNYLEEKLEEKFNLKL